MQPDSKGRTIKMDIRLMGYSGISSLKRQDVGSEHYFDSIDSSFFFDHAYDAILLTDLTGCVLEANGRAEEFFGYGQGELEGIAIATLIAGITSSIIDRIKAVVTEGRRYMRIQAFAFHKDATCSSVEIVVMGTKPRPGHKQTVCYLIRDTQSSWQAGQSLLSAYHAMDNTDAGIGIVNMDGFVTFANRKMLEMLGSGEPRDVVGHSLGQWLDSKTVIGPMREAICLRKSWLGEQRLIACGKSEWLAISAVPDIDGDSQLTGAVLSLQDIAGRRRAKLLEQQSERDRVMIESFAEAAHAFGQPATVLLSSLELLKQRACVSEESRGQMIDMAYEAALQIRESLKNLNAKRRYAELSAATPEKEAGD
jgi:PAS domain S-box-containing protein